MKKVRCNGDLERLILTPSIECCDECGTTLTISQHRRRPLQTLDDRRLVVARDKACPNENCPEYWKPIRPLGEGLLPVIPQCEYGIDIIALIGERRLTGGRSLPEVHRELEELHGVRISERHVSNLFQLFLALIRTVNGDTDAVRRLLRAQGAIVLSVDGVAFDDTSPILYVVRDVLSGEILYAERVERRDDARLGELLQKVKAIGIPILGVISDKEKAIVSSVAQVLPGVPHQYCQLHFLKNLAKPMESDIAVLGSAIRDILTALKRVERVIDDKAAKVKSSPAEVKVAKEILKAARAAATVSGDAVLNPAPVKRFQRMQKVLDTAKLAAKKRGGRWILLNSIIATLSVVMEHAELARRLGLQVVMLREIAHILDSECNAKQVERTLKTYLRGKVKDAPKRGRGAPRGDFILQVKEISDRFWPGLFYCYDIDGLPRTNNDIERMFGNIKRQDRKATGRKSTAGGPLETAAEFVLESWSTLVLHEDWRERLKAIPKKKLEAARKELATLAGRAHDRRSIQRDPDSHLEEILAEWREQE